MHMFLIYFTDPFIDFYIDITIWKSKFHITIYHIRFCVRNGRCHGSDSFKPGLSRTHEVTTKPAERVILQKSLPQNSTGSFKASTRSL